MVTGGPVAAPSSSPQADTTTRRPAESRRSNKPIMEKRRRARINNCLNELKSLILDAMKKDPARHSKLEKADILEMTVKHLENMQRQQVAMSAATDPQVLNKFRAGFSECAGEVGRFPGLEPPVRRRLLQHLANCLNNSTPAESTPAPAEPQPAAPQLTGVQVHIVPAVDTQVTSSNILFSTGNTTGLQLVPTRLPNGDIALVLPSSGTQILRQVSTPSTSPSPSSTSATSSSPLPLLLPIPNRTASAGSASSSPVAFERLTVSTSTNTPLENSQQSFPSPISPTSSTNSYDRPESPLRPYSPPQAPLSLVVKKDFHEMSSEDEKPWRPW
ncbi:protein hairy-like [Macrosteles quadrilineatus]|uniref:protein hairy-like n=1 Tax=Macrosteles quadrilineatus TaxID=74068 RepID=UPI0023E25A63|nr:protein hairy-like [Macrosteles quadrilineatus]XP_054287065.1 protein hairy-like [Macrosteles quadrilineatus]